MASTTIVFDFDKPKAIETILYLANKMAEPRKYIVCKMLYLADKTSLDKFGRFIFGETYVAMERGPVPSKAYDLMKNATKDYQSAFTISRNLIIPKRKADLDYLSTSDIECLDEVISSHETSDAQIVKDSHDDAWDKAWRSRGNKGSEVMPVTSIVKTLSSPAELLEYLTNSGDN